jgi:hypothetical protein
MPDLALSIAAALVAGGGVGVAIALLLAKRMASKEPEVAFTPVEDHPVTFVPPAPRAALVPAPRPNSRPERAPAMVLTTGVALQDESFERRGHHHPAAPILAAAPSPLSGRSVFATPAPPDPIPSEWARRQVGPVETGRSKGVCSGCGTSISVSNARPLRIACPVCGRTKLLAA